MMSIRTLSALFLGLLLCVDHTTEAGERQGVSKRVLDFMWTFNGNYSNRKQAKIYSQDYDLVEARVFTVVVPSLGQRPLVYTEQAANGNVQILVLCSVAESQDGMITLTPYILTNSSQYPKFGDYDIKSLSSLKPDDVQEIKDCEITVTQIKECAYFINWPVCSLTIDGNHPTFAMLLTCEELDVVMPAGGPMKPAPIPYKIERCGDRYRVPGAPIFYSGPCERNLLGLRIK